MKRVPTKRVCIDGKVWRIKLQRPPARETYDGLAVREDRTIYLHPAAMKTRGMEVVVHELLHARFWDIDEEAVEEFGRLTSEVGAWVARHNDGVLA